MKQHTTANLHVRVEKILESLRPFLRRDNGDVELVEITTTHIVRVELKGSCVSCPMSAMTLKNGIGEAIKKCYTRNTRCASYKPTSTRKYLKNIDEFGYTQQDLQLSNCKKSYHNLYSNVREYVN